MSIRVVSIISRMNVGGPAVLLSELFQNLNPEEFDHTLITGRCLPNEIDFLETHPLKTRVIYIDEIKRSLLPISDLKSFFKLVKTLRKIDPDIVHTHTSKAGVLGRLAAKIAVPHAKIVHTYHGHLLYGYFASWKRNLIVLIERFLSKISDVLIGVTKQVVADLREHHIGKKVEWRVIYPGLIPSNEDEVGGFTDSSNFEEGLLNIVWIGRFTDIKNPMLALESINSLTKEMQRKVRLIMIGAGELLDECQRFSQENNLPVTFTGWLGKVSQYLKSSDLLLMTSRNEGMPIVILEAALHKVPTLATNVGGIPEFIDSGSNGLLVGESVEAISSEISKLVLEGLPSSYGESAHRLVNEEFSFEAFLKAHEKLYREISK